MPSEDSSVNPADNAPALARLPEGMAGFAKGLAVIEAFDGAGGRMTLSDAAKSAGISRAAARRCLLTLLELGYVEHDGRYFRPLPRILRLGTSYLAAAPLPKRAQPILAAARDQLQESVSLAVFEGESATFVARAEAVRIVSIGVRVGARLPLYCSSTGRVLLAALSDDEVRAHLATARLIPRTSKTIVDPVALLEVVRAARINGYAITDEELEFGMRAMAVPVRDAAGKTIAAMSVSVSSHRVTVEQMLTDILPPLRDHAYSLERSLLV
jgi:IclR family pca regulon transcriptional regulator